MKEVIFEELTIKNFLSIGNVPLVFPFPSGINIITGFNYDKQDENGVGKSSVPEALFWVLFGETIRDLKKEEIINDVNLKDCVGKLKFKIIKNGQTKNFVIERGMKPSYCKLFVDGVQDETLATIPLVNEYIKTLISATPAIFKNCIILCLNESIPFMAQSKTERKEFVESMFRLEVVNHMGKIAKTIYSDLARAQELAIEKLSGLEKSLLSYKNGQLVFEENRTKKIADLTARKGEYVKQLDTLKGEIKSLDKDALQTIESEIKKLEQVSLPAIVKTIDMLSSGISTTRHAIGSAEGVKNAVQSKMTAAQKLLEIKKTNSPAIVSDLVQKLSPLTDRVEKDRMVEEILVDKREQLESLTGSQYDITAKIKTLNHDKENITKFGDICNECKRPFPSDDIAKKNEKLSQIAENIAKLNQELVDNKAKRVELTEYIETLTIYSNIRMLSNEFKDANAKLEEISAQLPEKEEALQAKKAQRDEISTLINSKSTIRNEYRKIASENEAIERQIASISKFLGAVDSDIEKANAERNSFSGLIDTTQVEIDGLTKTIEQNKNNLSMYEAIKFIASDQGIKSYVIKKLLKILNERISYYLKLFESPSRLEFDEFFEDKLLNEKGVDKSYSNFSGGERKRIDLACLFAFLDIRRIQGDVRFNTIVFDELIDSAISSKACNLVFNVLKERVDLYGENAYIITHRKEMKTESRHLFSNVINLEKRNGFTRIAEITNANI